MNKKLKIAIYSGEIPSTTFIERLILGLSAKDLVIVLFGSIKKQVNYETKNVTVKGYKTSRIQKGMYLLYYSALLMLFRNKDKQKLDKYLKAQSRFGMYDRVKCYPVLWHQPDIFHLQWAKGLEDWIWLKDFGIKLVLSLRGAHINYSPIADKNLAAMYQKYFPKVDAFQAVSKAIALEAQKYGAQKDKIKVIYSGLDIEPKPTDNIKTDDVFNILSVGRSHWVKGYSYALDACKILKATNFNFKYTIIGAAENEALLFQRAQLELENEVSLLDNMPFKDVKDAIQKADVMLLSSLEEGIANVVLEAMALGTLVVSTDCGGMAEVVIPNQTGYLVPIRDPEIMTQALKTVSELPLETYQQITKQARDFIETYHNETDMALEMQSLYDNLKQSEL